MSPLSQHNIGIGYCNAALALIASNAYKTCKSNGSRQVVFAAVEKHELQVKSWSAVCPSELQGTRVLAVLDVEVEVSWRGRGDPRFDKLQV